MELPQEEMDILEVSQPPLRSASHGDVKADLLQHHARLEKLLSEMLVKILGYILLHSCASTALIYIVHLLFSQAALYSQNVYRGLGFATPCAFVCREVSIRNAARAIASHEGWSFSSE